MANKNPKTMSISLRVLARLLGYPDPVLREHLADFAGGVMLHARESLKSEAGRLRWEL